MTLGRLILILVLSGTITVVPAKDEVCYKPDKLPWCVAEDRGNIVWEYDITNVCVTMHWTNRSRDWGRSECEHHPEENFAYCEVWQRRPKKVWGDPNMETLGHESMHGYAGDFHPDYPE